MTIGVLLAWSMVIGIINTTVFAQTYLANLARITLILAVACLIVSHRYLVFASLVVAMSGVIFLVVGFFATPEEPWLANYAADFIRRVFFFISGYGTHTLAYERAIVWAICALIGLCVFLFSYVYFNLFILLALSGTTFAFLLTSRVFTLHASFYVFVFCMIAFLIKYLNKRSTKRSGAAAIFAPYILPMTILGVVITSLIPTPQDGFAQDMLARPIQFVHDTTRRFTQPGYFSLRQTGFSGEGGRLGGNVELDDRRVMRLRTDSPTPIYLTGALFDTYTGYSWENHLEEREPLQFGTVAQNLDLFERMASDVTAVVGMTAEAGMSHAHQTIWGAWTVGIIDSADFATSTMQLGALGSRTRSIFHTGIVQDIFAYSTGVYFLQDESGRIVTQDRLPRNAWYSVTYRRFDTPDVDYVDVFVVGDFVYGVGATTYPISVPRPSMPEYSRRDVLRVASATLRHFDHYLTPLIFSHEGMSISYADLLDYYLIPRADWIYDTYLSLPATFPVEVRNLAHEVTREGESNYQRARMLEAYLNSGYYVYTLTPGTPPSDVDFVYHFLFEGQAGYCTYFATAFVTMARSIGLPARYVEGFMVSGYPDENGVFDVLNRMGHAWAEVYFEGYGWHRFEPTPAAGWPAPLPEPDALDVDFMYDRWATWIDPIGGAGGGTLPVGGQDGQQRGVDFHVPGGIWLVVVGICFILAIALIVRVVYTQWKLAKARGKSNREAVIHDFGVVVAHLALLRCNRKDHETATQFAIRAENIVDVPRLADAAFVFAKARYSPHSIDWGERHIVESVMRRLDRALRAQIGRRRYWLYKYVMAMV